MKNMENKLKNLRKMISGYGGAVIAFSGGVDSTFLAYVANEVLPGKVLAVTAGSETYPEHEVKDAAALAKKLGVPHLLIHTNELEDVKFTANPPQRCYFCKNELFARLKEIAAAHGLPQVLDGNNYDDRLDFRPGMQAAKELGIKSPLLEARLTKEDIRTISREMGLPTWSKPASPCLASRFPYGEEITREKLEMIKKGESYLRSLGLHILRLRHHGKLARIEVEPQNFTVVLAAAADITKNLRQIGYSYVTLDLQGFRSGSLNEVIRGFKI